MLLGTLGTGSQEFNDGPLGAESYRLASLFQALGHTWVFHLRYLTTVITNQKLAGVGMIGMSTAHKGVQAL
jgi:hypothetical protein